MRPHQQMSIEDLKFEIRWIERRYTTGEERDLLNSLKKELELKEKEILKR